MAKSGRAARFAFRNGRVQLIQSILLFTLGFLCAGFLALMVAPAIWRRAVVLTRKRIEASVPLTLNEIQADKDRARAEAAMAIRRLEINVKSLNEKNAIQLVELNRNREELKRLSSEHVAKDEALSLLDARSMELQAELRQREEQIRDLTGKLDEARARFEQREGELGKLGRMYEEASFASSNRQIQLVASESELEKLAGDISALRRQRKDTERHAQEISAENRKAQDVLKTERKRVQDLERKIERMLTTLTDREEKLERREKEIARLREQVKGSQGAANDADVQPDGTALPSGERERLERRLMALTRENKKLRGGMAANDASTDDSGEHGENAALREQIHVLAAEVVNLTAALDGPDSPIHKALAAPSLNVPSARQSGETITSLADRVRALQKAGSAR